MQLHPTIMLNAMLNATTSLTCMHLYLPTCYLGLIRQHGICLLSIEASSCWHNNFLLKCTHSSSHVCMFLRPLLFGPHLISNILCLMHPLQLTCMQFIRPLLLGPTLSYMQVYKHARTRPSNISAFEPHSCHLAAIWYLILDVFTF